MSRLLGLGLFLLTTFALGMDVESLPVWDPSVLVRSGSLVRNGAEADSSVRNDSLETHGYKTMQITVGDGGTQVDQELRLSIQGRISDSVYVDALLSDVGRKAGDQVTATLREVDQIYFRVEAPNVFLHLGDLTWNDESMGLYSMERSSLGVMAGVRGNFGGGRSEVRGVYGTDEVQHFSRSVKGVSGQREGFSLDESGNFISVVPGSETVWLNGRKLTSGVDYLVNYAGGLLDFKGALIPSFDDEIRIEYDAYENDNIYTLYGANANYRHPNLYLDLSGYRLENDVDRLKRGVWTDEDFALLKADRGKEFIRDDSLGELNRPERTERFGARMRLQGDHHFYADLEIALSRADTNTVSDHVDGPEGMAFRWYVTTDSSQSLTFFPLAMSVYGNRVQNGFGILENPGSDMDWNVYRLRDDWDLAYGDSVFLEDDLLHDELAFRMRFGNNWFGNVSLGYRRDADEKWNSSRANFTLSHRDPRVASDLGLTRVASVQEREMERYQVTARSEFLQGLVRPFGSVDFRYTEIDESATISDQVVYGKSSGGLGMFFDKGLVKESVGGRIARRRGDSFDDDWSDSLKSASWVQEAAYTSRWFSVNHLLQYEQVVRDSSGAEGTWLGELQGKFGHEDVGLLGSVNYKLGLTEEQVYTAVYKAVAPGTGDVRYDSLTGTYIEGVDNGDFVYEGMGRNDSVGAVRGSEAVFNADIRWNPGTMLGVRNGLLRDVTLGGSFDGEGNDTTGRKIYFSPLTMSQLRRMTSGKLAVEGLVEWNHPVGVSLAYKPGVEYDKKLSSMSYYEKIYSHEVEGDYQVNADHFVGATLLLQDEELSALQKWNWNVYDGSLRYRYDFFDGFFVQPLVRYRNGSGDDGLDLNFDADLWEGALRLGYRRVKKVDAFANFSVIQVDVDGDVIPYQVMAGYNDGRTYRLELSISVDLNDFISLGAYYVLRFGDAEENVFQKLSTEAKAVF